jgi:SAM-dependent methyltransferase
MSTPKVEFDEYAQGAYSAGMEDGFKRLMGESARIFLEHKGAWFVDFLKSARLDHAKSLLDVGCGTGAFLKVLQELGFKGKLSGCDVSAAMMAQSEKLNFPADRPEFHHLVEGEPLPFAADSFDVITVLCVYHHVEPSERAALSRELFRIVKPGGRAFIFEHNPWNPATQWIVSRCPIDVNAKLATAGQMTSLLRDACFEKIGTDYILFFPPRLKAMWAPEKLLSWLPLGGQYVTYGQKPAQ